MKIFIILAIALNVFLITHSSGDMDNIYSSEVSKIDFEPSYYLARQDEVCEVQIIDRNECSHAVTVTNAQQGNLAARPLFASKWAWVSPSCSVQTGGDWTIHLNSRREAIDQTHGYYKPNMYTQVCKRKTGLGLEDATLAASSTWSEGYVVDNIKTDTSPSRPAAANSLWHSRGGTNNWITMKFPYDVQLSGFRVKRPYSWDGSAFKGYSFQVSDDQGNNWTDVHSGIGENQLCCDFQTITFDTSTTGNYFRLFMKSNHGYGHHTISYMELLKTKEDEEKKMKEEKMEEELLQMGIRLSNEEETNRLKIQILRKQDEEKKIEEEEGLLQMAIKLSDEEETNRLKIQELRKQDEEKKMKEEKMEEEEHSDYFEGLLQLGIRLSNEEETNRLKIQKLRQQDEKKQDEEKKMKEKKMKAITVSSTVPSEEKMEEEEGLLQMAIKLSNEQETNRLELQKLREQNEILVEEKAEMTKKLLTERENNLQRNKTILEHAECTICTDTMVDPTEITCGHNFCAACLHAFCIAPPLEGQSVGKKPCPTCTVEFDTHTNYPVNVEFRNVIENMNNNILNQ